MDNERNNSSSSPSKPTNPDQLVESNNNNHKNNNNNNSNNSNISNNSNCNNNNSGPSAVIDKGGQERQQKCCLKAKPIAHRSQSSPSSLTTHKFGLRPTPSPPRLIIDHQTGDIIESYPEQPVYLRTYQPLDDDDDYDYSTSNAPDLDSSQLQTQSYPAPASLADQQQPSQYLSSGDEADSSALPTMGRTDGASNRRGFIPPPHASASKVYFAPPMPSAGGHLFHHDNDDDDDDDDNNNNNDDHIGGRHQFEDPISRRNRERDRLQMNHHHPQLRGQCGLAEPTITAVEANNSQQLQSTFKRAISKLNESSPKATTDIALVTHPDPESSKQNEIKIMTTSKQPAGSGAGARPALTPASKQALANPSGASKQAAGTDSRGQKVRYLSSTAEDNRLANKRIIDHDAGVESFGLYSFCYLFRILLVALLSSSLIYLLLVPLQLDCTKYRPTYTGVTRTLYSNISSSAFIVTTYSILVAVNLAIAIIFFLIGTCHFQRLITTPQIASPSSANSIGAASLIAGRAPALTDIYLDDRPPLATLGVGSASLSDHHQHQHHSSPLSSRSLPLMMAHEDDEADMGEQTPGRQQQQQQQQQQHQQEQQLFLANANEPHHQIDSEGHVFEPSAYTMSPIEAAWEYTKEQLELLWRAFHRFLLQYDLRFIGALHALCAICFQYLAIKVAVVRSYFCYSPVEGGDYV